MLLSMQSMDQVREYSHFGTVGDEPAVLGNVNDVHAFDVAQIVEALVQELVLDLLHFESVIAASGKV